MIGKDLKKFSRRELVDVIYQLKKNEQQMKEQIAALEKELQDKRMKISNAGSIAEAATEITNVFSNAQMTADLYLNEIICMKEDTEKECERMVEKAKQKVKKILTVGKNQYDKLRARYQHDYEKWKQLHEEIQRLEEQINVYRASE